MFWSTPRLDSEPVKIATTEKPSDDSSKPPAKASHRAISTSLGQRTDTSPLEKEPAKTTIEPLAVDRDGELTLRTFESLLLACHGSECAAVQARYDAAYNAWARQVAAVPVVPDPEFDAAVTEYRRVGARLPLEKDRERFKEKLLGSFVNGSGQ